MLFESSGVEEAAEYVVSEVSESYGDIAFALGSKAPRAVGHVMARYGGSVPWWRVVPATGRPPRGHARQALAHYLEEETGSS